MRKLLILSITCLMALSAVAQVQLREDEVTAVKFVQNETTDWYMLADNPEVTFTDHNPVISGKTYDLANGDVETEFGTAPAEKITLTAADFTVTKDGDWKYDQTEKKVKVEFISVENPGPPADKVEIYYNNDKMVKPIEPGTYQVYIDIRETDIYAAVTGITSDAWKFDIIDPEGAIQAIEIAIVDAIDAINTVANGYENVQEVMAYIDAADAQFEGIKNEAADAIESATNQSTITTTKDNAISEIDKIEESAKTNIQTAIASLKQNAINDIQAAADAAKEEIDGLGVDESAKSEAKAQIDNIANTAEQTINAATSKDAIDNAKTQAIADIHNVVQTTKDMWISVRENMTVGTYGTLCWKYDLTAIDGAELYAVAGIENDRVILEEVLVEETQAGAGYVILATAETLRVKNGEDHVDFPLFSPACNGLQGTFADIVDGAAGTAGNKLEGNYIIYQNEWRKCGGYTGLLANRAYLIMNYVPGGTVTPAPNRKYISMPLPKETPTDLNTVDGGASEHSDKCTMHNGKYIINGQFIIVKDGKKINALGIEL